MAQDMFLHDLGVVFIVAAITTVLFHRLKQPVVLGYIVAGIIVSPLTPPRGLISSVDSIQTISEIGLVFLLFSLGLKWSLGAVRRLGTGILVATPIEVAITLGGGYLVGLALGWTPLEAVLLGAALSISSTVIIMRVLTDRGEMDSGYGRTALGVNVVEDLIAVALISLLGGLIVAGSTDLWATARTLGTLALFIAVFVVIGYVFVPRLVSHVARLHVSDVLVVSLVGLAFGAALFAESFGFSAAFGAFLVGFLITGSERLGDVQTRIEPIRDTFGAVFFVSIGMLVDPTVLLAQWPTILAAAAFIIVVKPLAVSAGLLVAGRGGQHAFRAGVNLVPIGEMGFIIAGTAAAAGAAPNLLSVVTGVALITTLAAPYVSRGSARTARRVEQFMPPFAMHASKQYAAWTERLARRAWPDPVYRREVRRRVARVAINLVMVVFFFATAAFASGFMPERLTVGPVAVPANATFLGIAVVMSLPALLLAGRNLREIQLLVAKGMTPDRLWSAPENSTVIARVVRDTVGGGLLVVAAVLVLLTAFRFFPGPPVIVVIGILIAAAALLFFDAALAINRRLQTAIESAFRVGLGPDSMREVEDLLAGQYPWGVVFEEALVGRDSAVVGRPIGEVDLRRHTGATIVSAQRGDRVNVNPGPAEILVPGDLVLVAGEPEQVVRARDFIAGAKPIEATLDAVGASTLECVVTRASPMKGATLRELDLRNATGASVLALVRDGRIASHPGPEERLQAGDRVLLVGTDEQLARARSTIEGNDEGTNAT